MLARLHWLNLCQLSVSHSVSSVVQDVSHNRLSHFLQYNMAALSGSFLGTVSISERTHYCHDKPLTARTHGISVQLVLQFMSLTYHGHRNTIMDKCSVFLGGINMYLGLQGLNCSDQFGTFVFSISCNQNASTACYL